MTTDTDRIRAEFEGWFRAEKPDYTRDWAHFFLSKNGAYLHEPVQLRFEGWLACAARPVDVTEEMVERGAISIDASSMEGVGWANLRDDYKAKFRHLSRTVLIAALNGDG